MNRKLALIIGNSHYQDPNLAKLVAPTEDVSDLAEVLRHPDIGEFDEVQTLLNSSSEEIRLHIQDFFFDKKPDDLLLFYFSGHGVRDDQGRLYLAVQNTRTSRLLATAIGADFVRDAMNASRSKRLVIVLDCCHSGAFAEGNKAAAGESVGTAQAFEGSGYGRVVLTATDATQYAWEGDKIIGEADNSLFTHFIVEGLRTGAADIDGDGKITLDEMYDYVYERVVTRTPKQTPGKWSYKQQGDIIIARNPKPIVKPDELPIELRQAIESPLASLREGVVRELERMLGGSSRGLALSAREALETLVNDDSRRVSQAAAAALTAYTEKQRTHEEQERLAKEQAEAERLADLKKEVDRQAAIKAEQDRVAKAKAEAERLERLRIERERAARQQAAADRFALPTEQASPAQERLSPRSIFALTVALAVVFWAVLIWSAVARRSTGSSDVVPVFLSTLAVNLLLVVVRQRVKALTVGRMEVLTFCWLISGGLVYPLGYNSSSGGAALLIMVLPAAVCFGVAYWVLH
ncbi:MAG: caspase family protein [Anaerolineae bacterium]